MLLIVIGLGSAPWNCSGTSVEFVWDLRSNGLGRPPFRSCCRCVVRALATCALLLTLLLLCRAVCAPARPQSTSHCTRSWLVIGVEYGEENGRASLRASESPCTSGALCWAEFVFARLPSLTRPQSSLCCACYAPEGKEIMAGYQDGSLCVWERRRGQEVRPTQLLTLSPYTDEKRCTLVLCM